MLDLVQDLSKLTGWSRAEVLGLGLTEVARITERAGERRRKAGA